jgi:hypothetical protein
MLSPVVIHVINGKEQGLSFTTARTLVTIVLFDQSYQDSPTISFSLVSTLSVVLTPCF